MKIFKQAGELSCGVNDDGNLFFGDDSSGYNLDDTPENREFVLRDFENSKADYISSGAQNVMLWEHEDLKARGLI